MTADPAHATHDYRPEDVIPPLAEPWGGTSGTVDLGGRVHYVTYEPRTTAAKGARDAAPPLLLVHGLGGSSLNWVLLADLLRDEHRIYALDLAGHGFTRALDGLSASVGANAKLVRRFVEEVVGEPVVLVGNSMGGLISSMVASRHPELVRGLVLLDPALPAPRNRPDAQATSLFTLLGAPIRRGLRQRTKRRISLAGEVEAVLRLCIYRWERLDEKAFDAHVDLIQAQLPFREVQTAFKEAGRTMIAALVRRSVVLARLRSISAPVLLVQGDKDRLVHVSSTRWIAKVFPDWRYEEMAGVGHTPMLEVPEQTADAIRSWRDEIDLDGADAGRATG